MEIGEGGKGVFQWRANAAKKETGFFFWIRGIGLDGRLLSESLPAHGGAMGGETGKCAGWTPKMDRSTFSCVVFNSLYDRATQVCSERKGTKKGT